MFPYFLKPSGAGWRWVLLVIFCGGTPGCTHMDRQKSPDPAAPKPRTIADWMENLREPGAKGQQMGINSEAKDIERHLGYP